MKYSCEILEAQGIDRIPQIHKGSAPIAIAEKAIAQEEDHAKVEKAHAMALSEN